ncbi:hypothetical protein REPUB_Repub19eG0130100 [Reevesia pubescens]
MEDTDDQEELLNLSLAIVTDPGKIFKLLQVREEMVKLDHKRKDVVEDGKGLHLIHLLLITATSVDENNVNSAFDNLTELYQSVSLMGDSVQRVVAYFADGLAARLLTRKSPFYDMIMKQPTNEEEFLAFTCLYRASSGNRISLRLTGYGRSIEELKETETRLVSLVKGFRNLVFEFQGLLRGSKLINLRKKNNETVAVNLVFHLNTLNNFLKISDTLKSVHSLRPSTFILVEQEGSRSPRSFLSRFMESLHYFAAMFDSLDDCLPLESGERLSIEKNYLGKEIKNMINCDKDEENNKSCPRYEKMETWKSRMESHGFEGMKLSSKCLIQAKLLLKIRPHYCPLQCEGEINSGFRVFERDEGKALSLGWQDRCLLTASAWQCV